MVRGGCCTKNAGNRECYKSLKDVEFAADWCKYLCVQFQQVLEATTVHIKQHTHLLLNVVAR